MHLGHLDGWDVRKTPLHTTDITESGVTTLDAPGYATVRTNPFTGQPEALGVVGAVWQPIQNEDHAEFLNTLTDQSGAVFDTAGSLRGGRQVFITMQMPQTITVGGTDRIDLNIAALNSHDGDSTFRLLVTPVRVVCANTQAAALRNHRAMFAIRHTRNAKATVHAARDALGMTFAYAEAFETEAERMIQQTMTDAAFDALITGLYGQPEPTASTRARNADRTRRDRLHWLFTDAATQHGIRDTAWAGYQAVTEYVDHYAPVRTRGDDTQARATRVLTNSDTTDLKVSAWSALVPA